MVAGDIFPDMVAELADILAIPLTDIYNSALSCGEWPESWKEETMVVIPKCQNPASYSELRNLSCTALFSKVFEAFIIDDLKQQLKVDYSQYGSTKNCGVDHYLIRTWDRLLNALECENSACNLISIDFSKAFNLSLIHI